MVASLVLLFGLLGTIPSTASGSAACNGAVKVQPANEVTIRFDMNATPIKRIDPSYFGFNVEWVGFQADLWDPVSKAVHPDIQTWLKKMDGAIYRYPGGTVANHFKWRGAVGAQRTPQKAVDWTGPIPMTFGVDEYFKFLQDVDGKAWMVANLLGEFGREHPIEEQAAEAGEFASLVEKKAALANKPIIRWELGNELDRGKHAWSAAKYAANASQAASAIRHNAPGTQFVSLWPDYDAYPGVPAVKYADRVIAELSPGIKEFALHPYFDGPPGGPPVPNRLAHICKLVGVAEDRGITPGVWITEYARWPPGKADDPKWSRGFPLTANLGSAISTADFLIGTTQIKEVRGTMIHSLSSSKGPWPMFHRHGEHFEPSAVMLGLTLLRQGVIGDVLPTATQSPYDLSSHNPLVRAVSVVSPDRKTLWLTMVNRGSTRTHVQIAGKPSADFSKMGISEILGVRGEMELSNNYASNKMVTYSQLDQDELELLAGQNWSLMLPPHSILVLRLANH